MRKNLSSLFDKIEFPVLLAGIIVAGGLWGFLELMEVARDVAPHTFDTQILLAFREAGDPSNPIGSTRVEGIMRDITALGSAVVLILITAATIIYFLLVKRWGTAFFVLVAVGGGQILSSLLKIGIDRPRPDLISKLAVETSLSFPSGHAMLAAVTYLTLGIIAARFLPDRVTKIYVFALAVLVTLMVGVSRLYLGVHWPSDVLAGWCAGFAWAMLCWLVVRCLSKNENEEQN